MDRDPPDPIDPFDPFDPCDPCDRPGSVRRGEELDEEALAAFLRRTLPALDGSLEVRQFPSGYSNLTYLVRLGERELVLRRPPFGSRVATAHDMAREYRVLRGLHPVWSLVPEPLVYCEDPAVLGAPFYLMERVRGVILRAEPPPGTEIPPAVARGLSEAFIDALADLHAVDLEATGLSGLGRPEGYVERQVRGWTERYRAARTDAVPEIEEVAAWLAGRIPPERGAALVHNDYKYDNLVLDPADLTSIRAVLDWEMATVGDPWLDLGTSLGYWVEAGDPEILQRFRFAPTHLPGTLTRRELAERYAERSGRETPNLAFYYVFGLFKIAVIAQQIYARWKQGLTRDERFGQLIHAIRALGQVAATAAAGGAL